MQKCNKNGTSCCFSRITISSPPSRWLAALLLPFSGSRLKCKYNNETVDWLLSRGEFRHDGALQSFGQPHQSATEGIYGYGKV